MNIRRFVRERFGPRTVPQGVVQPDTSSSAPHDHFIEWAATLDPSAQVMEVGTKQAAVGRSSHFMDVFPHVPRANYLMVDVGPGADVDVVADLHALPADWSGRFDGFVACAVFEHLERPWIAAAEVARVLKPGGRCYIATHQTFPLHGFPSDFFRFSTDALKLIFDDAGISTLDVAYQNRVVIVPPENMMARNYVDDWNRKWPSYFNVSLFGEKPVVA